MAASLRKEREQRSDLGQPGGAAAALALADAEAREALAERELMTVVTVGHVDHGKSTLVGRLMADTGTIPQARIEAVRALCERQGKVFEYAFLLDALEAEREQGITIDAARAFFHSEERDYILVDAPGHVEFIRNMVSGAARAEAALLLLDAHEGIRENSRRHGKLLSLLGIDQIVVVVNKLDLIDFDADRYAHLVRTYGAFLAECGLTPSCWVPVSARGGDNVVVPSAKMPWYQGPTLLGALAALQPVRRPADAPLRLPVQDVYKFNRVGNDARMIVGRLEGGALRVGDEVVFSPSGKRSRVRALRAFAAADPVVLSAGDNAAIVLEDELFVPRGELLHHAERAPEVGRLLRGRIFWLGRRPLRVGGTYGLRLGTAEIEAEVAEVVNATDAATLGTAYGPSLVERNQIAEVVLRLAKPLAADVSGGVPETRRFVLLDGYDIWGGGQISALEALAADGRRAIERVDELRWRPQAVPLPAWRALRGHGPALVFFAGERGHGKGRAAAALQRALAEVGVAAVLLDADDVLAEAPRDTSYEAARELLCASLAHTARPLLEAGLVVLATGNAIGHADHGALLGAAPAPTLSVLLSPDRSARLVDADVVLAGDGDGAEAVDDLRARVCALIDASAPGR